MKISWRGIRSKLRKKYREYLISYYGKFLERYKKRCSECGSRNWDPRLELKNFNKCWKFHIFLPVKFGKKMSQTIIKPQEI